MTKKDEKRGVDFDFGKKIGKDEKLSPISKKSTHILKSASGKNKKCFLDLEKVWVVKSEPSIKKGP